jgi:hypothetical protein
MYGYNVFAWRSTLKPEAPKVSRKHSQESRARRVQSRSPRSMGDEQSRGNQHRVRRRLLPGRW